ncbi:histidine phosphotransferase family protein [Pararhodobacter zhoushanensis]|uniref:histidine phosphotransferase family protein n=1 Tax=Pararhodobacter zhoushanensis TaxID=2479545 RepID=UPI000F8DB7B7|nr:histidine phosphotransferase family protein [Pararhodobacter zhoushanensis]
MPEVRDLAALVSSRLCHDLVSPLGAIGNGVELMRMMQLDSPELDLIEQAAKAAQARVHLFRLAFGVAQDGQEVRAAELAQALDGIAIQGRVTLRSACTAPVPRPLAKRLTLAALCADSALPYGGEIAVEPGGVIATSPRLTLDADLWDPLSQGEIPPELSAKSVHFGLLASLGPVQIERDETQVTLRL